MWLYQENSVVFHMGMGENKFVMQGFRIHYSFQLPLKMIPVYTVGGRSWRKSDFHGLDDCQKAVDLRAETEVGSKSELLA